MSDEIADLVIGVLKGLGATTVFLLALFIGFSVIFGFPKLRKSGGKTRIVRSLDEMMGGTAVFLPPDAPRGPADQLLTPELRELSARKSG
jgi:hypothetical protein